MLFLVLCTFSEDEQVWIEQLFNENHTLLYKVSYQLLRLTELPNIFYNQRRGAIVSPAKFSTIININK